jgi:transcriptional regulator with XRE-family HTH domain
MPDSIDRPARKRSSAPTPSTTLEHFVGETLHQFRGQQNLTLAEVATRAGISKGMLSKIENGQSTSLDTLHKLAEALGIGLSTLFQRFDAPEGGAQHVRKGEGLEVVRRGTRVKHTYHLLAAERGPRRHFEPFLVTLTDKSEIFPRFEHPGTEFIYILEGRIVYRHGNQTYPLAPGDALTFRGDVPHGPERLVKLPIRMLSIIIHHDGAPD